jgi:hypothetical protein
MAVGYKTYLHTKTEPARTASVKDEINEKETHG